MLQMVKWWDGHLSICPPCSWDVESASSWPTLSRTPSSATSQASRRETRWARSGRSQRVRSDPWSNDHGNSCLRAAMYDLYIYQCRKNWKSLECDCVTETLLFCGMFLSYYIKISYCIVLHRCTISPWPSQVNIRVWGLSTPESYSGWWFCAPKSSTKFRIDSSAALSTSLDRLFHCRMLRILRPSSKLGRQLWR